MPLDPLAVEPEWQPLPNSSNLALLAAPLGGVNLCQGPLPVILKTCTQCGERQKEALTWAVGAWTRADGVRVAYRQKFGQDCTVAKLAPLQVHSDSDAMTCPQCGIDTTEDCDAIYISWIPKGVGKLTIEAPFCGACAAVFRVWWQQGAEFLPEREDGYRGASDAPRSSGNQVLAALGIKPRD